MDGEGTFAFPPMFAALQPGGCGSFLQPGAASDGTACTPACAHSFFYPGYGQLQAWGQAEAHGAAAMRFPAVVEQTYSFLSEPFEEASPSFPPGPVSVFSAPPPPPLPAPPAPPALPHQDASFRKRERNESKRPQKMQGYIKKPLNAFMLFMKERRPTVSAAIRRQGSGAVSTFLGSEWKSLSRAAQQKYYEQAEEQRLFHRQQHPGWSNKDNYGKMRMKARGK